MRFHRRDMVDPFSRELALKCFTAVVCYLLSAASYPEIRLDGTLGSGTAGQLVASGNGFTYDITQTLGEVRGANLFHSFQTFSIDAGQSANFSGDAGIQNIFSRVTGGTTSNIQGALSSSILGADVWVVNPAGVMIGSGASLNVSGSVIISSADAVIFDDGVQFEADISTPVSLTMANPTEFGFLAPQPAAVSVDNAFLAVAPGESFSIVSGNISINQSTIAGAATLAAGPFDNGLYPFSSFSPDVQAQGIIGIEGSVLSASVFAGASGELSLHGDRILLSNSLLEVGSLPFAFGFGGSVRIAGAELTLSNAAVTSLSGIEAAGDLDFAVTDVTLQNGSQILAQTVSGANGGNISFVVDNISLTGMSNISAQTISSGNAGDISIDAAGTLAMSESSILGTAQLAPPDMSGNNGGIGNAGNISINAAAVDLFDVALIQAVSFGDGSGGSINIEADSVSVGQNTGLTATTLGAGSGGTVAIVADQVVVNGGLIDSSSLGQFGGPGGSVVIDAGQLSVTGFGGINASTNSRSSAGNILISADDIEIAGGIIASASLGLGDGGNVTLNFSSLRINNSGEISAETQGSGNAGSLVLNGGSIILSENARIEAQTSVNTGCVTCGPGGGLGGDISINGELLQINGGLVDASTLSQNSGAGGNIRIDISALEIFGLGGIAATTVGNADAGDITISADRIDIDGGAAGNGISAVSFGAGSAGNISLDVERFVMDNEGLVRADTFGDGDAGSLVLTGKNLTLLGNSGFRVSADVGTDSNCLVCQAQGGNIQINVDDVRLDAKSFITTGTEGGGSAGTIDISGLSLDLRDQSIIEASTFAVGAGGSIKLGVNELTVADGSRITAQTSGAGAGGSLDIDAQTIRLDNGTISGESSGLGDGGPVVINANSLNLRGGGAIRTDAAQSQGGDIELVVADELSLDNGLVEASAGADGNGGDVSIDTGIGVLRRSRILAQAVNGNGGQIDIAITGSEQLFVVDSESLISADSDAGTAGLVTISSPDTDIDAAIAPQDARLVPAPELTADVCSPATVESLSSFVLQDQGGIAPAPDRYFFAAILGEEVSLDHVDKAPVTVSIHRERCE